MGEIGLKILSEKEKKDIYVYSAEVLNDMKKIKSVFKVKNEKGLHTRPSTELVKCAASFQAEIKLFYKNFTVNAKSLLGILMLAATRGSKIYIEAIGDDADQAVSAIVHLAKNKFNIKY